MALRIRGRVGGIASACRCAAALIALACVSGPNVASANGRYPAAGQIALDPAAPDTILVRSTYGLLLTKNHGAVWSWICEDAVGFGNVEDPMIAFTANGSLLAGTLEGLGVSTDAGCDWAFRGADLAGSYVIDLDVDKNAPSRGVLLASGASGPTRLMETADDGATWTPAGVSLPETLLALTVETAPSKPERVYVSGSLGTPDDTTRPGVILRSDDRGASWQTMLIEGSDQKALPYISAVDPSHPDVIYVRLDGRPTDRLVVSQDGGMTWATVFETQIPAALGDTADLLGFALSPDGNTVAVGGPKDGLWTAPANALSFTRVSPMSALCLKWAPDGLYGCGDELNDGFTAGLSTDQGKTWAPILHRAGLCGPLACDGSSAVTRLCSGLWPLMASGLGAPGCAGASSTGGAASSSATKDAAGGGGGGGASSGCGCSLIGGRATGLASLVATLLCAVASRGRRARQRERFE